MGGVCVVLAAGFVSFKASDSVWDLALLNWKTQPIDYIRIVVPHSPVV